MGYLVVKKEVVKQWNQKGYQYLTKHTEGWVSKTARPLLHSVGVPCQAGSGIVKVKIRRVQDNGYFKNFTSYGTKQRAPTFLVMCCSRVRSNNASLQTSLWLAGMITSSYLLLSASILGGLSQHHQSSWRRHGWRHIRLDGSDGAYYRLPSSPFSIALQSACAACEVLWAEEGPWSVHRWGV